MINMIELLLLLTLLAAPSDGLVLFRSAGSKSKPTTNKLPGTAISWANSDENTATTSGACTTCPTTTTTTTTTTTSTTSTTTTIPPVTLSLTPGCAGGPGTGTILANNFSGGTGSFEYISIHVGSGGLGQFSR